GIGTLEAENARLLEKDQQLREVNARTAVERLAKENNRLGQQLAAARKDSSNSSKPPSSDIVKPKKPLLKGGEKRKKGGQPGHEQHVRSPFSPEVVDLCLPVNGYEEIFRTRHLGMLIDAILIRLPRFPIPYMITAREWLAARVGPRSARGTSRDFSSR
ncbi:MAG: DUF6444 domain-containing protein, partial [Thermogutta sp.]